jgi:ABC-type uncharacterized transport system ATPase subunit
LRVQFGLGFRARIKTLSKGQQAKLGLLAAQAHRPDLLLLDEPSSGLDPIVRSDILAAAVIRPVAEEGRTVFFSSHLLEGIERCRITSQCCTRGSSYYADVSTKSQSTLGDPHGGDLSIQLDCAIRLAGAQSHRLGT